MGILNIAHRGYSGKFPENTMLAFKKAIEYGADGIETDVQMSKDGELVIIHDETLDRTTNASGFVKDYTLKELKKFRSKSVAQINGSKEDEESKIKDLKEEVLEKDEEIPTLRELLNLFANSNLKVLNLELKNSIIEYNGLEEGVLNMIDEFKLRDRVIISSFNHKSLVKIREIEKLKKKKMIVLGALVYGILVKPSKYLKELEIDCYHPYFTGILDKDYMEEIKSARIRVNTYTVNSAEYMKKVIEVGADSIITNEIEILNNIR